MHYKHHLKHHLAYIIIIINIVVTGLGRAAVVGYRYPVFKNVDRFSHFFTVDFRNVLRRRLELKRPPSLKSVAALPCEK